MGTPIVENSPYPENASGTSTRLLRQWWWLIALCAVKFGVQLTVADNYGFHRDEYLYLAQADHLGWGFMENPPLLAVILAFMKVFGSGIVWLKALPALVGTLMLPLLAIMVRDMGGQRWAQVLACVAFLFVPAYLRTHHLVQPVFLNQFFWVLLTLGTVKLLRTNNQRWWYFIGIAGGIGMLVKYSIAFPLLALIIGILLSNKRHLLKSKEPYIAALITFSIFLPNLIWQYNHNFPVLNHMEELRQTQLVNVNPVSFLTSQFLMLFGASLLWAPGLIALFGQRLKPFRPIAWMYVCLIGILLLASGKPYYTLGIYPVLIAAGAIWWEQRVAPRSFSRFALPIFIGVISLPIIPYGIPVLPLEKMMQYGVWMKDHMGLDGPLTWEDGVTRDLPQDYADMYGWEEGARNAFSHYNSLTNEQKAGCDLWGGGYGHAGALIFYKRKYDIPESVAVHSFNGSFALWAPDSIDFTHLINLDDQLTTESQFFSTFELIDSNRNRFARDPGYVYWMSDPKVDLDSAWASLLDEHKYRWSRKHR